MKVPRILIGRDVVGIAQCERQVLQAVFRDKSRVGQPRPAARWVAQKLAVDEVEGQTDALGDLPLTADGVLVGAGDAEGVSAVPALLVDATRPAVQGDRLVRGPGDVGVGVTYVAYGAEARLDVLRVRLREQVLIQAHLGFQRVCRADPVNVAFDLVRVGALGAALAVRKILGADRHEVSRGVVQAQPGVEIVITNYVNGGPGDNDALAALLAKGALNGVHFHTGDLDATFEKVLASGAEIDTEAPDAELTE